MSTYMSSDRIYLISDIEGLTPQIGWLYEESSFWHELPANNYFKWFHVFEDEINHRGQIRWMKKRLPENLS